MRWRIGLIIIVIAVVAPAIAGSAAGGGDAAALIQLGDAYRDGYLYTAAADHYLQARERQPHSPVILLRLCDIALRRARPVESAAYADQAERAGADPAGVAECRARAADAQGRAQESAVQWAAVAAARPGDREPRRRWLEALIAAHDWPAAIATTQALHGAHPNDPAAAFYLGALVAIDDPIGARAILLGADTNRSTALIAALDDSNGLADRTYRAVALGRALLAQDQTHLAWRAFVDATSSNPNYADAFAYLGATYAELGDAALASAHLDRALELDPQSAIGLYLRGVYLSKQSKWLEARGDLESAARLAPGNASIPVALARVLAELREYTPAEAQLVRAATLEPDNPEWQLALAEWHVGRLIRVAEKGLQAARRAVDLAPQSAEAHDWLGWGLHLSGDAAGGEAELRTALRLNPEFARARLHLGNLLVDVHRVEEGRTELQRAVDLDPMGEFGARARQLLGGS
jgi:tetratricopeptide (TPR) repeat protein